MIAWSRKDYGEFKLKNQEEVARRWGMVKHRSGMNYEKLSRAIRYYYHQGIIQKVPGQRLVYKFGELPYEYKPRAKCLPKQEIEPLPLPSAVPDDIKHESQAFLTLTSLTPPPDIGRCSVMLENPAVLFGEGSDETSIRARAEDHRWILEHGVR
ncbi:hypothetical protein QZH41_004688 [Actinostola sp. cb2023]|nr:hypothetical protein QZH41_004688 [Actinostola sp. cb2023]